MINMKVEFKVEDMDEAGRLVLALENTQEVNVTTFQQGGKL